ncbi:hypothetical protein V2J09_010895 [Rumex salicifolius]
MLAVIAAVHKWRPYLVGRHFKILTDHHTLKYFQAQRLSSSDQQKWVSKLLGYDYEICFRPGKHNQSADALSRLPKPELAALSGPIMSSLTEITTECRSHPSMQSIITKLQTNPSSTKFFSLDDDVLRYKGRFVVAPGSPWCSRLLEEFHSSPAAEWWYNTTYHSAIKMTPFEALYSRPPPSVSAYVPGSTAVNAVDVALRSRDRTLACLKANMVAAQDRMKKLADSHRTERSFQVGDWVYLRLQPYRQLTAASQSYGKLSPKFHGPFQVIQRIGDVATWEDATWECSASILVRYPFFKACGQASSPGRGDDANPTPLRARPILTYARRSKQ